MIHWRIHEEPVLRQVLDEIVPLTDVVEVNYDVRSKDIIQLHWQRSCVCGEMLNLDYSFAVFYLNQMTKDLLRSILVREKNKISAQHFGGRHKT